MGDDQYNKVNGRAAEAMFAGQRPAQIIDLDFPGGTPNQKTEKISNRVWYDHFFVPNAALAAKAVKAAIDLLQGQLVTGHMRVRDTDEVLTDSHAPIWLRGMLSLRLRAWKLRSRGREYAMLNELAAQWIRHHFSLLSLYMVPEDAAGTVTGPRGSVPVAGMVIGPCARKAKNTPGDQVRDVCAQLALLGKVISPVGPRFWEKIDQSTLAARFAREIVAPGGPGFGDFSQLDLPVLGSPLEVRRSPTGHSAAFPQGLKGADSVTQGWVRYDTGEYSFEEPAPEDIVASSKETPLRGASV